MLITTEKVDHLQTVNSGLKGRDIQVVYFNDLLKKVALEKKTKRIAAKTLLTVDLKSAQKAFITGPNTFFLGAGVSCSEGLPGWKDLLMALLTKASGSKIEEKEFGALFEANGNSSIIMGRYIRRLYDDDNKKMREVIHDCLYKNRAYGKIKSGTIQKNL